MHLANGPITHRMLENQWHNLHYKDLSRESLSEITCASASLSGSTVREHSSCPSLFHCRKEAGPGKKKQSGKSRNRAGVHHMALKRNPCPVQDLSSNCVFHDPNTFHLCHLQRHLPHWGGGVLCWAGLCREVKRARHPNFTATPCKKKNIFYACSVFISTPSIFPFSILIF